MKKLLISTGLLLTATLALAQPQKPTYAYYEGFNLSMGLAQNQTDTTSSTSTTHANTSVGLAKLNYTFALAYPAKLGVTATMDLKSSKVSATENLAVNGPTEITIEPGTQPGHVAVLRGHGMPKLRSGVRGDVHAHLEVVIPSRLDHKQSKLLKEFKLLRDRDEAEVVSTASQNSGGLFSRLREAFSGR